MPRPYSDSAYRRHWRRHPRKPNRTREEHTMSQPNTSTWYQATVHTDAESGALVTGQVVLIRRHTDATKYVVANATTGAILGEASATALAKYVATRRNRRTNKPLVATPTQRKALAAASK